MAGERGSGAGKGGGGGGTIREAGGSFGKMEAAHEDQYFYNLVGIYISCKLFCVNRRSSCLHESSVYISYISLA